MNGPPAGSAKQLTEEDKRYLRNRHRERIQEARERALLCREQFEKQRAKGEVGDDLFVDLATATLAYWRQTRTSVKDSRYEDDYPDTDALAERVYDSDLAVYEVDDLDPGTFADHIDVIDAIVVESGLLEMER